MLLMGVVAAAAAVVAAVVLLTASKLRFATLPVTAVATKALDAAREGSSELNGNCPGRAGGAAASEEVAKEDAADMINGGSCKGVIVDATVDDDVGGSTDGGGSGSVGSRDEGSGGCGRLRAVAITGATPLAITSAPEAPNALNVLSL